MNSIVMGSICFGSILSGTTLGYYLGHRLPEHHLDSDSKDTIKMAWGTLATMSALVLSLLLASAKSSMDTINGENTQVATNIVVLDQVLIRYGPETKAARTDLRNDVATGIQKIWPETGSNVSTVTELESGNGMEHVQDEISQLTPQNDQQRAFQAKAQQLCDEILHARWLVVEQSGTGLPMLLFVILVSWLTMLFMGLGLFAPLNKTVFLTLVLCSFSFSTAIFLINEMNHPLRGIMKISSAPMLKALEHLQQP